METKKKKGQLTQLPASALAIGVLVIVVAMVILILVGMNGSTTNAAATDLITQGVTAMGTYGDWFTTLVVIVIGVAILVLIASLYVLRNRGGFA